MMDNPLAIFDPDSRYNQLRRGFRVAAKIRGYFHWLGFLREQNNQQPNATEPHVGFVVPAAAATPPEVLVLDAADTSLDLNSRSDQGVPIQAELEDSFWVHVRFRDGSFAEAPYRGFLVDPVTLRHQQEQLGLSDDAKQAVRQLFDNQRISDDVNAAAVVSALPEFEGHLDQLGEFQVDLEVPTGCPNLPAGAYVVVVVGSV